MENFSIDDKDRRELRMLLKLIKRESCVLVLGPRIAVRASDPRGPTLDEVLIAKLHGLNELASRKTVEFARCRRTPL